MTALRPKGIKLAVLNLYSRQQEELMERIDNLWAAAADFAQTLSKDSVEEMPRVVGVAWVPGTPCRCLGGPLTAPGPSLRRKATVSLLISHSSVSQCKAKSQVAWPAVHHIVMTLLKIASVAFCCC